MDTDYDEYEPYDKYLSRMSSWLPPEFNSFDEYITNVYIVACILFYNVPIVDKINVRRNLRKKNDDIILKKEDFARAVLDALNSHPNDNTFHKAIIAVMAIFQHENFHIDTKKMDFPFDLAQKNSISIPSYYAQSVYCEKDYLCGAIFFVHKNKQRFSIRVRRCEDEFCYFLIHEIFDEDRVGTELIHYKFFEEIDMARALFIADTILRRFHHAIIKARNGIPPIASYSV